MRDIFEDMFERERKDPKATARGHAGAPRRRRFYQRVEVTEGQGGHHVLLDGKPARTPARRPLAAPTRRLADAIADEWRGQGDTIDPATMPVTRLANSIIDGVAAKPEPVAEEVEKYLASDLVCYRAAAPEGLVARQADAWDPVLAWAHKALGARFVLGEGLVFVLQPEAALTAARAAIPRDASEPRALWRLGALHAITTLTGSALIALAVLDGWLPPTQAWAAAHVDEDWNMDLWGRDDQAMARRAARFAEMQAAGTILDALR